MSFKCIGIELEFVGQGINERGIVAKCDNSICKLEEGQAVVGINEKYFRPAEVDMLIGDATKAKKLLGWKPKYTLQMLVEEMMQRELILQKKKIMYSKE